MKRTASAINNCALSPRYISDLSEEEGRRKGTNCAEDTGTDFLTTLDKLSIRED